MKTFTRYPVSPTHPAFAGHFPGRPVVPGAMLLDQLLLSIAQVSGRDPGACEFQSVKFLSPALPGDELEFRHEWAAGGLVRFEVSAGSRKIATGSLKTVAKG
ncbi:3-hydroxyacyl-ACP dehydratase FabZ family protein [Pseudomonadota bacterium]